jgi:hypothetical protein
MTNRFTAYNKFGAVALSFSLLAQATQAASLQQNTSMPFKMRVSYDLAVISKIHTPEAQSQPDFIIIESAPSNPAAQQTISAILKQLQTQHVLPERIAVESDLKQIDMADRQRLRDPNARKRAADYYISLGELTGAMHYVMTEGQGQLYEAETRELFDTSVEMFRRSFKARTQLARSLAKLDAALGMLRTDPGAPVQTTILAQDVQALHRLLKMKLTSDEIHHVMDQAIYAVDHLEQVLTGDLNARLLQPVSAAVNFYVLALLRDEGLFQRSLQLREEDEQNTTIVVASEFHTLGMTQRLKKAGYSYVVITPRAKQASDEEERRYVQRILGHPMTFEEAAAFQVERQTPEESWALANKLSEKLRTTELSMPPIRDIFTAMDRPWMQPSVQLALVTHRQHVLHTDTRPDLRIQVLPND